MFGEIFLRFLRFGTLCARQRFTFLLLNDNYFLSSSARSLWDLFDFDLWLSSSPGFRFLPSFSRIVSPGRRRLGLRCLYGFTAIYLYPSGFASLASNYLSLGLILTPCPPPCLLVWCVVLLYREI